MFLTPPKALQTSQGTPWPKHFGVACCWVGQGVPVEPLRFIAANGGWPWSSSGSGLLILLFFLEKLVGNDQTYRFWTLFLWKIVNPKPDVMNLGSSNGGFHSHGGTPIAGWFTRENPSTNGWFGGTSILWKHPNIDCLIVWVSWNSWWSPAIVPTWNQHLRPNTHSDDSPIATWLVQISNRSFESILVS